MEIFCHCKKSRKAAVEDANQRIFNSFVDFIVCFLSRTSKCLSVCCRRFALKYNFLTTMLQLCTKKFLTRKQSLICIFHSHKTFYSCFCNDQFAQSNHCLLLCTSQTVYLCIPAILNRWDRVVKISGEEVLR